MIRQPEDQSKAREAFPLYLFTGLFLGLLAGIFISWFVFPARQAGISPEQLSKLEKEEYRTHVAMAYAANGDAQRAAARLNLLGDLDPIRELNIQAQLALLNQDSQREARALSQLAQAIYAIVLERLGEEEEQGPNLVQLPDAFYALTEKQLLCNGPQNVPVLQIYVLDHEGLPAQGVALELSSESGSSQATSGERSENGAGFAQFDLFPQSSFSLSVEGLGTIDGIQTPDCLDEQGNSYWGSLLITLRAIP